MGADQHLLGGMELDQVRGGPVALQELTHSRVSEGALDEALAQARVAQPALLLGGEQRQASQERLREEAASGGGGRAVLVVDLHAFEPARRRALLEHVAVEPGRGDSLRRPARPRAHAFAEVGPTCGIDEADLAVHAGEPDRRARDPQPDLDLGTEWDVANVARELLGEKRIALVAPVEADLLAQQAGGDADANLHRKGIRIRPATSPGPPRSRDRTRPTRPSPRPPPRRSRQAPRRRRASRGDGRRATRSFRRQAGSRPRAP